jgi:hypothetical protein
MPDKVSEVNMTPIDLVTFAEYSEKLPTSFLGPKKKTNPFSTLQVLTGHFIDFSFAFGTIAFMALVFNESMRPILMTKALKAAYQNETIFSLSASLFPAMVFCYFFLSYFMNHGQTYGMYVMKRRMVMKENSFQDALRSAAHSFILCFTCGLSFYFQNNVWNKVSQHDYLYEELLVDRDLAPIDLLSEIDKISSSEIVWTKAA